MEQLRFPVTRKEAERAGIPYSSEANKNALFPSRLRALREEKGVSQAVLASTLGVSKSTIGLYETGDTLPDIRTADQLANYFEVSSDFLLCRTNDPLRTPAATDELGLSHGSIMEIKSMGTGALKRMLNTLISDPDFANLLFTLNEIGEASKIQRLEEISGGYQVEGYMDFIHKHEDIQEYVRKELHHADAQIVYGEFLVDLLHLKVQQVMTEIIAGIKNNSELEAEEEADSQNR